MVRALRVVAAVIQDGNRILACRRRPDKSAGGRWEFPGGKVEPSESAAAALRREILEELATEIRVIEELTTNETLVDSVVIRLTCFRAELAGAPPTTSTDHLSLIHI